MTKIRTKNDKKEFLLGGVKKIFLVMCNLTGGFFVHFTFFLFNLQYQISNGIDLD